MAADRILPLCELLLGAAYADKELKDQEKDEVRSLLEGLTVEVETEELKETFKQVRKGPPPVPTPKAKSVDVDMD